VRTSVDDDFGGADANLEFQDVRLLPQQRQQQRQLLQHGQPLLLIVGEDDAVGVDGAVVVAVAAVVVDDDVVGRGDVVLQKQLLAFDAAILEPLFQKSI
jgi:hypothetical protein